MNIEDVKAMIPSARPCGGGYRGPCPSCGGGSRSTKFAFSERDGKILLHCFSGCTTETICQTMNIELRDLFVDAGLTTEQRRAIPQRPRRLDWRRFSHDFEFASEHHWLRAESIFQAAGQCDVSTMNDKDLDQSWRCLGIAFHSVRVSENLGIIACNIRITGMAKEAA